MALSLISSKTTLDKFLKLFYIIFDLISLTNLLTTKIITKKFFFQTC